MGEYQECRGYELRFIHNLAYLEIGMISKIDVAHCIHCQCLNAIEMRSHANPIGHIDVPACINGNTKRCIE